MAENKGDVMKPDADHVEMCLKTLRSCVAKATDAPTESHSAPPARSPNAGKSNYMIESYNPVDDDETDDEEGGEETYEEEGGEEEGGEEEGGEETYVLEGAPYVSTGMTRMGVLLRILFAIFLILFVLYMSKQV